MSFKASAIFWTIVRGQPIEAAPVVRFHAKVAGVLLAILLGSWLLAKLAGASYRHAEPVAFGLVAAALVYLAVAGFRLTEVEKNAERVLARQTLVIAALALALLALSLLRIVENPSSRWSPGVLTLAMFYAIRLGQRTWLAPHTAGFWVRRLHWVGLCVSLVVEIALLARMAEHLNLGRD